MSSVLIWLYFFIVLEAIEIEPLFFGATYVTDLRMYYALILNDQSNWLIL